MSSYVLTLADQSREYVEGAGIDLSKDGKWFLIKGGGDEEPPACYRADWVLSIRKVRPGEHAKPAKKAG